eukprot:scaffold46716_cov72-Phaeocystis_antarctica.AAC.4
MPVAMGLPVAIAQTALRYASSGISDVARSAREAAAAPRAAASPAAPAAAAHPRQRPLCRGLWAKTELTTRFWSYLRSATAAAAVPVGTRSTAIGTPTTVRQCRWPPSRIARSLPRLRRPGLLSTRWPGCLGPDAHPPCSVPTVKVDAARHWRHSHRPATAAASPVARQHQPRPRPASAAA